MKRPWIPGPGYIVKRYNNVVTRKKKYFFWRLERQCNHLLKDMVEEMNRSLDFGWKMNLRLYWRRGHVNVIKYKKKILKERVSDVLKELGYEVYIMGEQDSIAPYWITWEVKDKKDIIV